MKEYLENPRNALARLPALGYLTVITVASEVLVFSNLHGPLAVLL